jgi:hypothetical protein
VNQGNPSRAWAPVCPALGLLLLTISLQRDYCDAPTVPAVLPATSDIPFRPKPPEPPPDAVQVEVRPPAPARRPPVKDALWDFNHALHTNGTIATGGSRPELLIDENTTVYDGATGYAYTNWPTKPPPSFVITFKEGVQLNAVRFLLWDQDSRFYRYKLEASPAMARDEWVLLADRTGETNACRGWQVVTFKTQIVCRLRLTGTYNSANEGFHVVEVEAYNIPAGLACPWAQPEF